jgi:uncharacterized protein (DUF58 family)
VFGVGLLTLLGVLLVFAALAGQTALFLFTLVLLAAAGLSRLWWRYCLSRVEYRRRFSAHRLRFGDELTLEAEVVNRKLLPLSWLEVEDEIPRALPPSRGRTFAAVSQSRDVLASLGAYRPFERVRRRYAFPCRMRGEHMFGPVRLRSGDLFGFVTREETLDLTDSVVVYPRLLSLPEIGIPAREFSGDLRARSWLFEDPSRMAGARDYRPGDSLRRIHWPATARVGALQSRVYEASTDRRVELALNLVTNESLWWSQIFDADVLELTIATAATIAEWTLDAGYLVGLGSNGMYRGSWESVGVQAARDPDQLERILFTLGRLRPYAVRPFEEALDDLSRRLPFGTTLVVVTASLDDRAAEAIRAAAGRGHGVSVVYTGRYPPVATVPGHEVWRVGPPELWREGLT